MKRLVFIALVFIPTMLLASGEHNDDWWIPHEDTTKARVDQLERDVGEIRRILLVGNGHKPMTERVASLEQALETQTWLLRVILGGVLASLVGQFAPLVMRGRKATKA